MVANRPPSRQISAEFAEKNIAGRKSAGKKSGKPKIRRIEYLRPPPRKIAAIAAPSIQRAAEKQPEMLNC